MKKKKGKQRDETHARSASSVEVSSADFYIDEAETKTETAIIS